MEFFMEFFTKLSPSSLDSKQNRRMGMLSATLAIEVAGAPGHGGLRGEGETKREERGTHGAAYLVRKTTAAARRRGSGLAGGGPR
jgi:hypothetical protein